MQNAHLRLGRLEYRRSTEKNRTRISVYVDHYIGEKSHAHLLSVFGNDADIGAVTAAVQEGHQFELSFPDGPRETVGFGKHTTCYKGALKLPEMKRPLRHLLATSDLLQANGSAGKTFILHYQPETVGIAWCTLAGLLGVPADPRWAQQIFDELEKDDRIQPISGIGCQPVVVLATRTDLLDRVGRARTAGLLAFPEKNGPILWPHFTVQQALNPC
jgi:hypothetical protein